MDATRIYRLRNPVRNYAWGSRTAIPELLDVEPTGEPQAELWMGAHPSAPSLVVTDEGEVPLDAFIRRDPEAVLGRRVVERFGPELPFLFKVLAAEQPLSIQAHPSEEQARAGFARENAAGIPLDAPNRSYRDPHHKPELICALTPFRALNRFREVAEIHTMIEALDVPELDFILAPLRKVAGGSVSGALACFFEQWITLSPARRTPLVDALAKAARQHSVSDPACAEVARLAEAFPGDAGVLAPLFLNLVELRPGEAMYLPAGELHAYLGGVAVELMANSDNVLRGGLTPKHVDVPELLRTLSFRSGPVDVLEALPTTPVHSRFEIPAAEFDLARIDAAPDREFTAPADRMVEILLCTSGTARISDGRDARIARGETLLVPAAVSGYRIEGEATIYRAAVPERCLATAREA